MHKRFDFTVPACKFFDAQMEVDSLWDTKGSRTRTGHRKLATRARADQDPPHTLQQQCRTSCTHAHVHAKLTCLDLFPAAERCSCMLFIHGMGSKPQSCLEFYRIYQAGTFHWIPFGGLDRIYVVKKKT